MGFFCIGVRMDDLVTAAATIQGAQIQANYALWSALIGAFGIVFAAWYAWQSGVKLQQHNNIIEAKREVYLEAISNYYELIGSFSMINVVPDQFFELFLNNCKEFSKSIHKVSLICESKNKKLVSEFSGNVETQILSLIPIFNEFREAHSLTIKAKSAVQIASDNIDKYVADNLTTSNIEEIDNNLQDKITTAFRIATDESKQKYSDFESVKNKTEGKASSAVKNLHEESQNFSNALRAELKIED